MKPFGLLEILVVPSRAKTHEKYIEISALFNVHGAIHEKERKRHLVRII